MYPAGWPDKLIFGGSEYTYTGNTQALLSSIAMTTTAETTQAWLSVLGYPMDDESRKQLVTDLYSRSHPLSCLGMTVLTEHLCREALGMPMFAAGRLASAALKHWLPFSAWAATRGIIISTIPLPEMLAAAYGWQAYNCPEEKDLAKLNLNIFGTKKPW